MTAPEESGPLDIREQHKLRRKLVVPESTRTRPRVPVYTTLDESTQFTDSVQPFLVWLAGTPGSLPRVEFDVYLSGTLMLFLERPTCCKARTLRR